MLFSRAVQPGEGEPAIKRRDNAVPHQIGAERAVPNAGDGIFGDTDCGSEHPSPGEQVGFADGPGEDEERDCVS